MEKSRKGILWLFLFVGVGLMITTIAFADAGKLIKAPSHPGKPLFADVTRTGCLLKYLAPQRDGGEPVTDYYIEYKEQWDLSWKFKGSSKTLEYRIENMKKGSKVRFRVSASNSVGMSERPSKSSDFITFSNAF